ncbi:MAG: TonB-dependent receptor [Chloroherpetonaceae bacterium]|nr:TonB-dependent receptor [Chloroherpetonaceae bacterium]
MLSVFKHLAWLCALAFASTLIAQSIDSTKTVRVDEIRVEATRLLSPSASLHSAETLSKAELDKLNAITVADAVRQLPSVTLKDYGGIGGLKTISVRSLGAEHTAVQIDGIKISDAQTGQIDLGRFSIQNLDQIELINGNAPDMLQPARAYASASVLNLVSKIESFHRSARQSEWRLGSQVGSFEQFNQSASLFARLSERASLGVDIERISANGEYDYRLQNGRETMNLTRRNADLRSIRAETDLAFNVSDRSTLFVKAYFYDSERGLPSAVAIRPNPDLIEVSRQRLWHQDAFAQTRIFTSLSERLKMSVGGKFAYNYLRFIEPALDPRNPNIDDRYVQREIYGAASLAYRIGEKTTASLATDLAVNALNASHYQAAQPTRWTSIAALALAHQGETTSLETNLVATYARETTVFGTSAPNRNALTPSIAIGYKPFADLGFRLRASHRQTFRLPTFNDLYYARVGNPNLRPEYARQWNVGVGYERLSSSMWKQAAVRLDAFRIDVTDKILAIPRDAFNWSMRNIGAVQTTGFDARVESQLQIASATLSLVGNYARQEAIDVSPASLTPNQQIPYAPKELASAHFSLEKDFWSIGYALSYTGFRFALPENEASNVLPAFWLNDVSLSVGFPLWSFFAKAKFEASNLFNARYEVIQFFPMPARNFRLSLNLTPNAR